MLQDRTVNFCLALVTGSAMIGAGTPGRSSLDIWDHRPGVEWIGSFVWEDALRTLREVGNGQNPFSLSMREVG